MKKAIKEIRDTVKAFRNHVIRVDKANQIVAVIDRSKAVPADYHPGMNYTIYITGRRD